jgi:aspartate kinase
MLSLAIYAPGTQSLSEARRNLSEHGTVNVMSKMSIVSVIAHRMRNVVGISAEIFSALASAKVNIYPISQGASEIDVS